MSENSSQIKVTWLIKHFSLTKINLLVYRLNSFPRIVDRLTEKYDFYKTTRRVSKAYVYNKFISLICDDPERKRARTPCEYSIPGLWKKNNLDVKYVLHKLFVKCFILGKILRIELRLFHDARQFRIFNFCLGKSQNLGKVCI